MKKAILALLLMGIFMVSVASGCCSSDTVNTNGNENQEKNANANAGDTENKETEQEKNSEVKDDSEDTETKEPKEIEVKKVKTIKEAKEYKGELKQQIKDQVAAEKSAKKQATLEKKRGMSEAVHMLLAMEKVSGGIGPQVSEIAKEFNNSYEKELTAENAIESRSWIKQFFLGGDKKAAKELKAESKKVKAKITELEQIKGECSNECDTLITEQITNLETEQARVIEVANTEEQSNGMFGWLF